MGSGAHNERLQSLRGLAALCVLFGHVSLLLPFRSLTFHWAGVFQPNSAVIFFYVLSGYVLGESLRRDPSFARFILKRMMRLLPVFWIAVLLGAATHILVAGPPIPGASDWLNGNRANPVSACSVRDVMNTCCRRCARRNACLAPGPRCRSLRVVTRHCWHLNAQRRARLGPSTSSLKVVSCPGAE